LRAGVHEQWRIAGRFQFRRLRGILPARGARRSTLRRCARLLDAIEALPQSGIFLFQGIETLNDRVLVTCPCCCGDPLKREDGDSTPNNVVQLHVSLLSNNATLKRVNLLHLGVKQAHATGQGFEHARVYLVTGRVSRYRAACVSRHPDTEQLLPRLELLRTSGQDQLQRALIRRRWPARLARQQSGMTKSDYSNKAPKSSAARRTLAARTSFPRGDTSEDCLRRLELFGDVSGKRPTSACSTGCARRNPGTTCRRKCRSRIPLSLNPGYSLRSDGFDGNVQARQFVDDDVPNNQVGEPAVPRWGDVCLPPIEAAYLNFTNAISEVAYTGHSKVRLS
jgi:hypothetical protein